MSLALCDDAQITLAHLPAELLRSNESPDFARGGAPLPGAMRHEPFDAEVQALNAIQSNERDTVLSLLDTHRWNVSHVAKVLNISRNTLYRKMHRLHIALSHDAAQRH
jgi:transcriptional regulator of acetoin/glycerol metabolism